MLDVTAIFPLPQSATATDSDGRHKSPPTESLVRDASTAVPEAPLEQGDRPTPDLVDRNLADRWWDPIVEEDLSEVLGNMWPGWLRHP